MKSIKYCTIIIDPWQLPGDVENFNIHPDYWPSMETRRRYINGIIALIESSINSGNTVIYFSAIASAAYICDYSDDNFYHLVNAKNSHEMEYEFQILTRKLFNKKNNMDDSANYNNALISLLSYTGKDMNELFGYANEVLLKFILDEDEQAEYYRRINSKNILYTVFKPYPQSSSFILNENVFKKIIYDCDEIYIAGQTLRECVKVFVDYFISNHNSLMHKEMIDLNFMKEGIILDVSGKADILLTKAIIKEFMGKLFTNKFNWIKYKIKDFDKYVNVRLIFKK